MFKTMGIVLMVLQVMLGSSKLVARQPEYPNRFIGQFDKSWNVQHDDFLIFALPKCGTHFIQRIVQLMIPKDIMLGLITKEAITEAKNSGRLIRTFVPYSVEAMTVVKLMKHKVIAMIRDPRDALISHVFYMRSFANKPNCKRTRDFFIVGPDFDLLSLDEQIKLLIIGDVNTLSYIQFYKQRLRWALNPYNLAVKYESLVNSQEIENDEVRKATILNIARYLNVDLSSDHLDFILAGMSRVNVQEVHDGKIFIRGSTGNWRTFLNAEHKKLLKERIGQDLIRLGYEKDFNW